MPTQSTWIAVLVMLLAACGPVDIPVGGHLDLSFAKRAIEGPCPEEPDLSPATPALDRVEVVLYRSDGTKHFETGIDLKSGELTIASGIKSGEDLRLTVIGYESGSPAWSGSAWDLTIRDGKYTHASVLMTRIADMSCTFRPLQNKRMFLAAAELSNGQVLLAGGLSQIIEDVCGPDCDMLRASANVDIFDVSSGLLFPTTKLNTPRALATATRLQDGSILVVGGASKVHVGADNGLPVSVAPEDLVETFEIFLPDEDRWVEKPLPEGRVFHSATLLQDGRVLVAGGGTGFEMGAALETAIIFDPAKEAVGDFVPAQSRMSCPRFGHAAVRMNDGKVLIVGGATYPNAPAIDEFAPADELFTSKEPSGPGVNLFFHDAIVIPLRPDELLIAGGSFFDGTSSLLNPANGNARVYSRTHDESEEILSMEAPHLMNRLVALGNDRVLVAGGFTDLALQPGQVVEEFDPGTRPGSFSVPINDTGNAALSTPRGGHAVVQIRGGRALISGGMGPEGLLGSAEIYTPTPKE